MVAVITNLRWQVEGYTESHHTLAQQVMVAFVAFLSCAEAGVLPHGPELAAIHIGLHATRKRFFTGLFKWWLRLLQVVFGVHLFYFDAAVGINFFISHNFFLAV